jgi:hypothetical protein
VPARRPPKHDRPPKHERLRAELEHMMRHGPGAAAVPMAGAMARAASDASFSTASSSTRQDIADIVVAHPAVDPVAAALPAADAFAALNDDDSFSLAASDGELNALL